LAIKCYLSGIEYRITNKYSIHELAGQPADSTIDVLMVEGSIIPVSHQKVELKDDDVTFFLGYIQTVDAPTYSTTYETDIYSLKVASAETVFTRRLVSGAWRDKYTHEIIADLFSEYISEEGFTLGTISNSDRLYEVYTVPRLKLSDVLQELGDEIGCTAQITPAGVFNFVNRSDFVASTPPEKITKLKKSETGKALKSVQIVSGAKAETSSITRSTTWESDQETFLLGYQVADEPAATINGNPVNFGLIGVDEGSLDKTFLWRYGNNVIILNQGALVKPSNGDIVVVVFKGFYSIEVVVENEELKGQIAAISGTSGKIESLVVDTSITSELDGQATAEGLLNESSAREESVSLECKDVANSKILNVWTLNYPELGVVGDYVIVERTITDFYEEKKVQVKLKNRGFYSRYGTVYNKSTKQINNLSVRADDVVIKSSSFVENMTASDTWLVEQGTLEYYPSSTDLVGPVALELGGFYPSLG
jgi:hypothetical protein